MNIIHGTYECIPEALGYDSSRIPALDKHFERLINNKIIHGASYCIARRGRVIASGAVGYGSFRDSEDRLMKPDNVFPIASITKIITTTAFMQLLEDGLIRLDTPVKDVLPQFGSDPFDKITMRHLLTHTSGMYPDPGCFPEDEGKSSWDNIDRAAEKFDFSSGKEFDWIAASITGGLRRPVGTEWQYCSFGFMLMGEIISRVSGINVHKYITDNIFTPIGMTDTMFDLTREAALRCFTRKEEDEQWFKKVFEGESSGNDDEGTFWEKLPRTGGGVFSTVYDLVKFGNTMLYGGSFNGVRILGRKSLEKMTTLQFKDIPDHCWGANTPDRKYGVGFDMRMGPGFTYSEGSFCHEGAGACSIDIDPKEELVAAWYVPFVGDWSGLPLYNTQNVIWSGII